MLISLLILVLGNTPSGLSPAFGPVCRRSKRRCQRVHLETLHPARRPQRPPNLGYLSALRCLRILLICCTQALAYYVCPAPLVKITSASCPKMTHSENACCVDRGRESGGWIRGDGELLWRAVIVDLPGLEGGSVSYILLFMFFCG